MIAPEHPGYGETEMPEWLDGFEDLVIHYDELLDVLGLDQVHVVGYSLGGWLAAEFAAFYPKRLKSLTLMVPAGLRIEGKPIPNPVAMMPDEFLRPDLQRQDEHAPGAAGLRVARRDRAPVRRGRDARPARVDAPQYDLEARAPARTASPARRWWCAPSTTG